MLPRFLIVLVLLFGTCTATAETNYIARDKNPINTFHTIQSTTHLYTTCIEGYKFAVMIGHMTQTREFNINLVQIFENVHVKSVPMKCK